MSPSWGVFKTDHEDVIHEVAFDFYGTRMATCSSDHTVRVWQLDNADSQDWSCLASLKAHNAAVYKVTWAHPEYGQVLATCSFDRTTVVWKELPGGGKTLEDRDSPTHWVKRTTLTDSKEAVTDVKFSPRHMGLVLASCSVDGFVRIYESLDTTNTSDWILQHEIAVKFTCSCITWNPTYPGHFAPMFAVGSDDETQDVPKVLIYEYNGNSERWIQIKSLKDITDPVNDISFASNLGRTYHLLGVASEQLRIVSLDPQSNDEEGSTKMITKTVAQFADHNATVWRVLWNVQGSVLASTGDDGCVRLWKAKYKDNGKWGCVLIMHGDLSQVPTESTPTPSPSSSPESDPDPDPEPEPIPSSSKTSPSAQPRPRTPVESLARLFRFGVAAWGESNRSCLRCSKGIFYFSNKMTCSLCKQQKTVHIH